MKSRVFLVIFAVGLVLGLFSITAYGTPSPRLSPGSDVLPPAIDADSLNWSAGTPEPLLPQGQDPLGHDPDQVYYSVCGWVLTPGEPPTGIQGATTIFYAWDGANWVPVDYATSAGITGYFVLNYSGPPAIGFAIREINPPGYSSVSAEGPAGWVEVSPDRLEYFGDYPVGCVFFYDQSSTIATATAAPSPRPTATPTPTATFSASTLIFEGHVYRGPVGHTASGIYGTTVQLWGSSSPGSLGTMLASTSTGTGGAYSLVTNLGYPYYHLIEIDRPGYSSVGAASVSGGVVVNPNWIRHQPPAGGTYPGNDFWDDYVELTPTPTPTTQPLFFAGYVVLDLPNPVGIPGTTVTLYAKQGENWSPVDVTTTDESGHFDLTFLGQPAEAYTIVETNLPGYRSVRAEVPDPAWLIISPDEVRTQSQDKTTGCVYFYDIYEGPTPTPTNTVVIPPTATPTPTSTPVCLITHIEAEDGILVAPMTVGDHVEASRCDYVYTPLGFGANGRVIFEFEIAQPDTYVIWARAWGMDAATDSFYVSIDGGSEIQWDIPQGGWTWGQVRNALTGRPLVISFTAGTHTVAFRTRENGSRLDAIEVAQADPFCQWLNVIPCLPEPFQSPTPSPTPEATSTPTSTATPTVTDTPTATSTATDTPIPTETFTPMPSETPTETPTFTPSPTGTITVFPTDTPTPLPTETPTETPIATPTSTQTATPSLPPTMTHTPTHTPPATATATPSYTPRPPTPTVRPTSTPVAPPEEIPEAGTLILLGSGLSGLAGFVRMRRRRRS